MAWEDVSVGHDIHVLTHAAPGIRKSLRMFVMVLGITPKPLRNLAQGGTKSGFVRPQVSLPVSAADLAKNVQLYSGDFVREETTYQFL